MEEIRKDERFWNYEKNHILGNQGRNLKIKRGKKGCVWYEGLKKKMNKRSRGN